MAGWIAPTIAVSLVIMAACVLGLAVVIVAALREGRERSAALGRELGELRQELTPALAALNAFSEAGADVAQTAREEVEAFSATSTVLREEVHRALGRARRRLDDFDALVEVMHEEVEDAAVDIAVAVRTVRASRGILGRLRGVLLPGRRRGE